MEIVYPFCGAQTWTTFALLLDESCKNCPVGFQYDPDVGNCTYFCQGEPTCNDNGLCVSDTSSTVPYCSCNPGYMGSSCNILNCPGNPECNNRGKCVVGESGDVVCQCENLYTGDNCSTLVCPGYPNNICNGRGFCNDDNGSPECVCTTPGYYGDSCQNFTAEGGNISCPGDPICSDHGDCDNGTCVCDAYWEGSSCGERNCPETNGLKCSNRGDCIGTDTYSYCNCTAEGWIGLGCELVNETYCPNNCSGQTCVLSNIPFCDCKGSTGKDCSDKININNNNMNIIPTWEIAVIYLISHIRIYMKKVQTWRTLYKNTDKLVIQTLITNDNLKK